MLLSFFQEQATDCISCNSLSDLLMSEFHRLSVGLSSCQIYLPYVLRRTGRDK